MEKFAENSEKFMKGNVVVFSNVEIVRDELFKRLIKPSDEYDVLTDQALKLIFSAMVVKTKKMLADHLEGDKYGFSAQPQEQLMAKTQSIEKTNVGPERKYCMLNSLWLKSHGQLQLCWRELSCLIKIRLVHGGKTFQNQTGSWRDNLPKDKKELAMQM